MCWLLVFWSLVSLFFRINFREKEFNWKASCKTIRIWWFCDPSKTFQNLVEKSFGPMNFKEKIMGGNKIKNVLIISDAKLRLMSPLCIKVYVGNTPPIHCIMMMGHLLAAPEWYAHYNDAKKMLFCYCNSTDDMQITIYTQKPGHDCWSWEAIYKGGSAFASRSWRKQVTRTGVGGSKQGNWIKCFCCW